MHNLCHAPGCQATAIRGWTRCSRHFVGAEERATSTSPLTGLTVVQRRIHADTQLHGITHYGYRQLPAVRALFDLGLVDYRRGVDDALIVTLPYSESTRLKGPWRRDDVRP